VPRSWNSHPIGISLAIKPKEAFYVPIASHENKEQFNDPQEVRRLLSPIFADSDIDRKSVV
jgi:DNA polymerase-1